MCQESSTPSFFWQTIIFAYLIMLQIMGIVLALLTRKVKLRGLRDSKYIAAIIYIWSISIVVMALVNFALGNYINIGTGILSAGIFSLTTMFLVLVFLPKVRVAMLINYVDNNNMRSIQFGFSLHVHVRAQCHVLCRWFLFIKILIERIPQWPSLQKGFWWVQFRHKTQVQVVMKQN